MVEIATRRMAKNNVQVCLDNKIGIENNPVWLKKIRGMAKTTPLILSGKRDSNPRPLAWEANALPTELLPRCFRLRRYNFYFNVGCCFDIFTATFFLMEMPHLFQVLQQLSAPLSRSGLGISRARTFQVIGK